jgi:hypothetical protein
MIKIFEEFVSKDGTKIVSVEELWNLIEHAIYNTDNEVEFVNTYSSVDFIDYLKELFIGRKIRFRSQDATQDNPKVKGVVEDVDVYSYQMDELFIQVKIKGEWVMIHNWAIIQIYNYEPGPLAKQLEIEKEAGKYNL